MSISGAKSGTQRAAIRWTTVVDVGDALTMLERIIGSPTDDDTPGRLVGLALVGAGVGETPLSLIPIVGDVIGAPLETASPTASDIRLTLGAVFALRAADRADRAGISWERALFAAYRAVNRYLELVPPGVRESLLGRDDRPLWVHSN